MGIRWNCREVDSSGVMIGTTPLGLLSTEDSGGKAKENNIVAIDIFRSSVPLGTTTNARRSVNKTMKNGIEGGGDRPPVISKVHPRISHLLGSRASKTLTKAIHVTAATREWYLDQVGWSPEGVCCQETPKYSPKNNRKRWTEMKSSLRTLTTPRVAMPSTSVTAVPQREFQPSRAQQTDTTGALLKRVPPPKDEGNGPGKGIGNGPGKGTGNGIGNGNGEGNGKGNPKDPT
ncbi:12187_t:CDS:2 [Acaulospora colombiana]|uniref:12187_t:CDS:1 n=1 Tax=Acaulospora colombiana TaxID=27376 RepID=A0ACA9M921_9GLOM|nr:12187_t:CDS:2 [Acaulospora colombiana]